MFLNKRTGEKKKQILEDEVPSQGGVIKIGYSDSHPNAAVSKIQIRNKTNTINNLCRQNTEKQTGKSIFPLVKSRLSIYIFIDNSNFGTTIKSILIPRFLQEFQFGSCQRRRNAVIHNA